jgi:hypothetical protein
MIVISQFFFRFVKSVGYVDGVSARKFLDAALGTKDIMIFYTVFKFFEQRNIRLRGTPKFPSGECKVITLVRTCRCCKMNIPCTGTYTWFMLE